ncbi:MAG: hypothetical protein MUE67_04995 [Anaerolineales bacterium]|nr:hypothetical protein [Anaerolineales bacterium]
MIEFPEAITIARQVNQSLKGKRIQTATRGNSPHKFAFYSHSAEEYAAILPGKIVDSAFAHGSLIIVNLEPDERLVFGEGGERILFHTSEKSLPTKYHFSAHFDDDSWLTVAVQGWGAALLYTQAELENFPRYERKPVPLSPEFTLDYFISLFEGLTQENKTSLKFFLVSEPGVLGVGNGILQDILFRARLHPRTRAAQTTSEQRVALYTALCATIEQAVALGGRDTEHDLFDKPGKYVKLLDARTVGQPCPICRTKIQKESFLGGTVYFCPRCQPSPNHN